MTPPPATVVAARAICDSEDAGYVVACEGVHVCSAGAAEDGEREEVRGSMVSSDGRKTSAIKTMRAVTFVSKMEPMHVARFEDSAGQWNGTTPAPSLWRKDERRRSHGGKVQKKEARLGRERLM